MARVLVTGGAGFIGSHLIDALVARGHGVVAFDDLSTGKLGNINPKARLIMADIRNAPAVRHAMIGVDAVFHLAAVASVQKSNEDWVGTHQTNSMGTVTVMDAARSAKGGAPIPVIYASSAAVYGKGMDAPLSEVDRPAPMTSYGADKLSNELQAKTAGLVHGLPSCGFRFFNVYGPRQDPSSPYSGVISIFAERMARGDAISVHGDGEQTRDFIHVSDIVSHLLEGWSTANETAPVFNACTGQAVSLNTLIQTLSKLTGKTPDVIHTASRAGDIRHSIGNPTQARDILGVTAKMELGAGLSTLITAPPARRAA